MQFPDIYQRLPGLVLGFHGCDESVGEDIFTNPKKHLDHSANDYDWLGGGIYFWENDPQRAWEFAKEAAADPRISKGKIKKPCVVGAVLDLGLCCNLLDRRALDEIKGSYDFLKEIFESLGDALPINGAGRRMRRLDCLVIENMHELRENQKIKAYDTVRGAFWEGGELYPGAAIERLNHLQIAVRNKACIKGYFRPRLE
ncbi:hypothetical protein [Polaromonas sp. YR568]|uniref:hypothetical protein n=1 Tax=Polaromonas sp. YR568 TaxID=1855301 RepID=UPI00398C060A